MIHTFYHHGEDEPATGLSRAQVVGALHDAAGIVWLDIVCRPADTSDWEQARDMLENVVRLDPDTLAMAAPWLTAVGPVPPPWHGLAFSHSRGVAFRLAAVADPEGGLEPVAGFFGDNYLVTVHQRDLPTLAAYREAVTGDAALMEVGADRNVARLLWSMLGSYAGTLDRLAAELGESGAARDLDRIHDELDRLSLGLSAVESAAAALAREPDLPVGDAARVRFQSVAGRAGHYRDVARQLVNRCATLQTRYHAGRLAVHTGLIAAMVAFGVPALVVAALIDAWRGTTGPVDVAAVLLAGLAGLALSVTIKTREEIKHAEDL